MDLENEIIVSVVILYVIISLALVAVQLPPTQGTGNEDVLALAFAQ